jgi:hypothetical protein
LIRHAEGHPEVAVGVERQEIVVASSLARESLTDRVGVGEAAPVVAAASCAGVYSMIEAAVPTHRLPEASKARPSGCSPLIV